MAYFDFLIDKGNAPKPIEYIYRLDCVWILNSFDSIPIEKNSIVTDVVQRPNGAGYEFTVKNTGERYQCTYAWSFAENTRENRRRIRIYDKAYHKFLKHQGRITTLYCNIKTLKK
ncbi:MAG: hypothetical protein EHM34_04255 [Nitrosopumilales archaeon]|nr:MAG: hypothetical protein EHM34_04255 [Nitrosopumilales archaeon]